MMKLENIDKYYNINTSSEVHALKNINLSIEKGEMVAIMGVSGSGKSTLIHILGCLDKQTYGKYFLGEYEVTKYSNNDIAVIRNEEIGFVRALRGHVLQPALHGWVQLLTAVSGQGIVHIQQKPPHAEQAQVVHRDVGDPVFQHIGSKQRHTQSPY